MTERRRVDELGLRRAIGELVLPLVVGAMTFLAALAAAGVVAAGALAWQWRTGAEAAATVQVPDPDQALDGTPRIERVLALLRTDPAIVSAQALSDAERAALLRPWFGGTDPPPALPLPGVVDVRLAAGLPDTARAELGARVAGAVPGATLDSQQPWTDRLQLLAASLQACAWLAVAIVAATAALVVAVVTRGGLLARREAIQIVHGLGATDNDIARRFARRASALAAAGAGVGALAALPVLLMLAGLARPFASGSLATDAAFGPSGLAMLAQSVPGALWATLAALPCAAAAIGFVTADHTVRRWLRRLP